MSELRSPGHLFVIDGDLNKIKCDAVLLPTDSSLTNSTNTWASLLQGLRVTKPDPPVDRTWKVLREPTPTQGRPVIWFGNVGEISPSTKPYVSVAAEFVRQSANFFSGRAAIPRIALNVLGSGRGGQRNNRGKLIKGLVHRLIPLAAELSVDIILVTWGTKQYAAAQRARQRELERLRSQAVPRATETPPERCVPGTDPVELSAEVQAPAPTELAAAIDRLAAAARTKRLVLFVGAGVSSAAGLPSWQELVDKLAERAPGAGKLDLDRLHELDLRDQAQVLARRYGQKKYERELAKTLESEHYSLAHGLLASMDPREVVTTNYDTLLEAAYGSARQPAVLPYESVGLSGRWVLKLHGTIDEIESVVLTREDYLGLPERSQALFGIVQAMLMTKHMLFVGYSLSDDSFHRIVHDVRRARQGSEQGSETTKIGTVLTLFDDPLLRELWGNDLDIVGVAPQPPAGLDRAAMEPYIREASRSLEIVLDYIALKAADVTPFFLDNTYSAMLEPGERRLKSELAELTKHLDGGGMVGIQIRELLGTVLEEDPKDNEVERRRAPRR